MKGYWEIGGKAPSLRDLDTVFGLRCLWSNKMLVSYWTPVEEVDISAVHEMSLFLTAKQQTDWKSVNTVIQLLCFTVIRTLVDGFF